MLSAVVHTTVTNMAQIALKNTLPSSFTRALKAIEVDGVVNPDANGKLTRFTSLLIRCRAR